MSWNRKWRSKTVKDVLEQEIKEKEIVIVQSHVSFYILTDCPDPSCPRACPVVPLCRDNEGSSVPLSWKVALSLPLETLVSLQSSYSSFSLYLPNFILKFLTLQAAMDDNSRAEKQAWWTHGDIGEMSPPTVKLRVLTRIILNFFVFSKLHFEVLNLASSLNNGRQQQSGKASLGELMGKLGKCPNLL